MNNVVTFPTRRRERPKTDLDAGQARILLFTGIRYVRDEVEVPMVPALPAPMALAEDRLQA